MNGGLAPLSHRRRASLCAAGRWPPRLGGELVTHGQERAQVWSPLAQQLDAASSSASTGSAQLLDARSVWRHCSSDHSSVSQRAWTADQAAAIAQQKLAQRTRPKLAHRRSFDFSSMCSSFSCAATATPTSHQLHPLYSHPYPNFLSYLCEYCVRCVDCMECAGLVGLHSLDRAWSTARPPRQIGVSAALSSVVGGYSCSGVSVCECSARCLLCQSAGGALMTDQCEHRHAAQRPTARRLLTHPRRSAHRSCTLLPLICFTPAPHTSFLGRRRHERRCHSSRHSACGQRRLRAHGSGRRCRLR